MSPKWKAHTFIQPVLNVIPDKRVLVWGSTHSSSTYNLPEWMRSHQCTVCLVLKSQGACSSFPPSCPELPSGTDIDFFSWSMWVQVDWATSVHIVWHEGWSRVNLEEIVSRTCLLGGHGGWGKEKAGLWCGWFSTAFQVILRFCQGSMLAGKKMLFLLNWVLAWFPTLKSR